LFLTLGIFTTEGIKKIIIMVDRERSEKQANMHSISDDEAPADRVSVA